MDVTNESDFKKLLGTRKIHNVLAEHVFEHLSTDDISKAAENLFKFTSDKSNIRIAVPDGFHKSNTYIDQVRPGGIGIGANDHKNLFDYKSLSEIFNNHGFKSNLIEYWDEEGNFHSYYIDDDKGFIKRCYKNDPRNRDGNPNYTSLIIDFYKG